MIYKPLTNKYTPLIIDDIREHLKGDLPDQVTIDTWDLAHLIGEIERLKEEYVMLQNASDEVEEEKDKEIERLNKTLDTATEIINNKHKEIVILNNIIKEVREYIKYIQNTMWHDDKEVLKTILEILDKGNNNE